MKKQIKKSLSLFLAVLMLMSCWVWVAPEKAAAADGQYYVKVYVNVETYSEKVSNAKLTVNFKKNNGKGEASSTYQSPASSLFSSTGNDRLMFEGYVDGFPTSANFYCELSKKFGGTTLRVGYLRMYVGKDASSCTNLIAGNRSKDSMEQKASTINGDKTFDFSITTGYCTNNTDDYTEKYPYLNSVTGVASAESKTIPSIGSNGEVKTTSWAPTYWDQYGVKWIADATPSIFIGATENATSALEGTDDQTKGFYVNQSGKNVQVVINEKMQVNYPVSKDTTTKDYYLFAMIDGGANGSTAVTTKQKITVTYPKYTIKVNPKGSVNTAGFNPTITLNKDGLTQTGDWIHEGPYGVQADTYPTGAIATGYTFKGFWTTKQPTDDGDASVNASEATFATPVSSKDFVEVYGGTEGAEYVEKDGKKYFNAGTQWDGAAHKEITGNEDLDEFFGWWVPKDIVVKFYDVDGAFLGTKTTKYGTKPAADWYLNPKDGYNAGAYDYQGFAGKWRDITGAEVVEGSYTFGALETLSLTPIYTKKTYSDKHQVNFVDTDGSYIDTEEDNGIASGKYDYRHILSGANIPKLAVPAVLVEDPGFSYEFSGWTTQKPASGNYHTVAKDDSAITENTDWVVRDEITYYAIFRSTVKEYLVNFNYTDSTGAAKTESLTVPYGSAIATPNVVNRTYAKGGYGYTLEGWDYQANTGATVMLDADETLVFDNTKVFITTNNLAPNGTPIKFRANYDEGQPTPYTVTFKFKDATGKDKVITDEVYHGYAITQEIVDRVTVPAQYDDGTALYTFSNLWKVTEGTADKAEYTKAEFTSFKPVSHVTFEALYGEGVPFYTVKYIDGAKTYEERVLAGSNVPAWLVDVDGAETEYAPSMADSETGKYNFEGWFDAKQTDANFAQTNGTEYTTASIVNSDLVLYPQFKFEPFKFTIKFMNFDGTVQLAAAEVEAGKSFEAAFIEAQRAAQLRDADETYTYEFIGWDHKVPDSFLCEGKDMTYTALYKPNYVYYEAEWYNDASMSGKPLATTKHTYNSAVYAPAVNLTLPEAETGKTTVFAGWKYLKDGVETDYVRGMKITAGMKFYATYDYVNQAVTLTTVVGTVETEYSVEYNKKANVGNPADGYVDATNHNKFVGWYTDAAYKNAFDMANTALTADTTIYAKFETAAHSKTMKELKSAPTYYATGSEIIWCACNREETDETVEIPMLTDTKAPTGTIYLGGHSWSSTGTPAYTTDNDPISIFVNANADIVITSNDTGDVNTAYNPSGIGKGVAKIRAFAFPANTVLTADNYGAAQSLAVDVYTNDTQDLNNNANFSIKVGDIFVADLTEDGLVQKDENGNVKYKALEDGESYIIYYYVNDKAGNQLNRLVRTAKFTYDNTPAEITVAGDSNAATANGATVTYCGKAVIKGIENGSTVLVNGEKVALTTSGVSGTTAYTIAEAGNYVITVTDKAGNTATKKIIVADGHDEVTTSKAVTCTEDGYEKVICAVCGKVIKNETIESEGHKYSEEVTVAPTCTEDGYKIKTCSVCGDEVKTPGEAKTGHTYNKDADGNVIYVTVTPSTCKVKGKAEAKCTVCGEGKLEKELELDTVNGHKYGATKVLKATCTQDGEEYQNCKYCYAKNTVKVLEKLNHVGTGTYTKVTTAPTCYAEGVETTYCKGCDAELSTAPVAKVAHTLVLVKYEGENNDDVANYPYGYMQYECKATGCTHTEGKTAITVKAEYTVTFVGAGAEGADVVITKTEGESIEATAVADQTKASDNEYDYTFKGWKAESTGKVVKLPVKVAKNETYTAEFTATKRVYTHTFKINEKDEAAFATIIGTYNSENKKPAAVPTKEATEKERYEFAGWVKVGDTTGVIVDDFTMTEDATFTAKFAGKELKYTVSFLNGTSLVMSTKVQGGSEYNEVPEGTPEKEYDNNKHYTFAGWYLESGAKYEGIESVTANTKIYAKFTSADHVYGDEVTVKTPATCTAAGSGTVACECGRTKDVTIDKLGHDWEKGTVLTADMTLADGTVIKAGSKLCARFDACGVYQAPDAKKVTIKFMDGEELLKEVKVEEGKTYTYTAPEKESTAQHTYKFVKWTFNGADYADTAEITVTAGTADAVYKAVYESTVRVYNVTYMDETGKKAITTSKVAFGGVVPAAPAAPEKDYDDNYHYEFSKWSVAVGTVVDGDIMIYPEYTGIKHEWYAKDVGDATCTETGGTKLVCDCGITSEVGEIVPALGHAYEEIGREDAEIGVPGSITYKCSRCGVTKSEEIPALKALVVTVKDGETFKGGVVVDVQKNGATVATGVTAGDGKLTLGVAEGTYTVIAEGVEESATVGADGGSVEINISADNTGDDDNSGSQTPSCSCGCHRPGFWGIVFRFFHKIISWFTGRIGCCSCPDPAYK